MDQNPLPRGSLQVRDRLGEDVRTVPELPQTAVAVEAQYPAHPAGAMIVVEVLGVGGSADGAAAALSCQQFVELHLPDAVTTPRVMLPRPGVPSLLAGLAARVVAKLAGEADAAGQPVGTAEVVQRLHRTTVRTPLSATGHRGGRPPLWRHTTPATTRLGALCGTPLAVVRQPIRTSPVATELGDRQDTPALRTCLLVRPG